MRRVSRCQDVCRGCAICVALDAMEGRWHPYRMDEQPNEAAPQPKPLSEKEWQEQARNLIRLELRRQNVKYDDLSKRLRGLGVSETEVSIRNKISRGTFPATFLIQCLAALNVKLIPVPPSSAGEVVLAPELFSAIQGLRLPADFFRNR